MKLKINLLFLLLCFTAEMALAQKSNFRFKREITGVENTWHQIEIPDNLYKNTSYNLNDLRILGITQQGDTLEAPYVQLFSEEESTTVGVNYKVLNTTHNAQGYFYTFELNKKQVINKMELNFSEQNFDWRVKLEGSSNGKDWFTLLENYRILSINNNQTQFAFTRLLFPDAQYLYFRLNVVSNKNPGLTSTQIAEVKNNPGVNKDFAVSRFKVEADKKEKSSNLYIELEDYVPIRFLKIDVKDSLNYYRPVTIKALRDSIKTEKGWVKRYDIVTSGTLNSFEENVFDLGHEKAQQLKITVHNQNNAPLNFAGASAQGTYHHLAIRFPKTPAQYFLCYGGNNLPRPNYDIARFKKDIPTDLTTLELGQEQKIEIEAKPIQEALFENQAWLWAIMIIIIGVLGWFTLKMLRKAE